VNWTHHYHSWLTSASIPIRANTLSHEMSEGKAGGFGEADEETYANAIVSPAGPRINVNVLRGIGYIWNAEGACVIFDCVRLLARSYRIPRFDTSSQHTCVRIEWGDTNCIGVL
jgi:hypothetical protein